MYSRESNDAAAIEQYFFMKHNQSLVKLSIHDILYVKVEGRYTEVHLNSKRYVCRKSLTELQHMLPESLFVRSHRNFLVNKHSVTSVLFNESSVYLTNGTVLPVSARYLSAVRNLFPIVS